MYFICSQCGIKTKNLLKGSDFCSIECRLAHKYGEKPTKFECEWCFEAFTPTRRDAKYCTTVCRSYACHGRKKQQIYVYRIGDLFKLRLVEKRGSGQLFCIIPRPDAHEIVKRYGVLWQDNIQDLRDLLNL